MRARKEQKFWSTGKGMEVGGGMDRRRVLVGEISERVVVWCLGEAPL